MWAGLIAAHLLDLLFINHLLYLTCPPHKAFLSRSFSATEAVV